MTKAKNRVETTLDLLEKVNVLMDDVFREYFNGEIKKDNDSFGSLVLNYNNARIKTDIIYDYILELGGVMERLQKDLSELSEQQRTA